MRLHKSLTTERVLEAVHRYNTSLSNPGFCVACGEDAEGVEPDARGYCCEYCGALKVYGAEELMLELIP